MNVPAASGDVAVEWNCGNRGNRGVDGLTLVGTISGLCQEWHVTSVGKEVTCEKLTKPSHGTRPCEIPGV